MRAPASFIAILLGASLSLGAQDTGNPHGPSIGACANCHRPDGWRPARISAAFKHAEQVFPLDGAHARTACMSCHTSLVFSKVPTTCAECHRDVHKAEFGAQCARCHTTRSFVDQTNLRRMHELTRFPLRGAHAAQPCEACHSAAQPGQAQFVRRPTTCIGCHSTAYKQTKSPDHQAANFPQDCTVCHTMVSWKGGTFDHQATRFPLDGGHRAVACQACHADGVFTGKPTTCVSCHQTDYTWTKTPPHAAAGFPTTCATCHTVVAWKTTTFDHDKTLFALTGAHRAALCTSCHADNVYKGKSVVCVSCHRTNYDASLRPPHSALGWSTACATCHTTTAWAGAPFDHATTQFPLTGAHRTASCADCHADGVYRGKPSACATCHQKDYAATSKPAHAAAGFSTTCQQCHNTTAWLGAPFDHSVTRFPLTGAHRTAACADCHADGVYRGKPMECVACHQKDYAATKNPSHTQAGYPTTCAGCHGTSTWLGAGFDHSATAFPLAGAHRTVACASCHGDGVYKGKSTACVSCHQAAYNASAHPPHSQLGFSTVCATCHTSTAWTGATFDHSATAFPLTGAHRSVACASCHADGVYKGKSTACASCHQAAYNGATLPPHSQLGFSAVCSTCHTTTAWAGGTFDHNTTRFVLTGAHRAVSCSGCHGDGVYRGKTMLCAGCHQARYDASVNPPHKSAAFPTTCEVCHSTSAWTPATFNHSSTRFPLTGAHTTLACASCHGDGIYRGKVMTCVGCHLAKYNATTNPNHKAANFPTVCESCHTTTRWPGATFNHDGSFFPIYSGKHKGRWTTCADCHTVSTNYASFSCFSCHRQTDMDSKHRGRTGYRYDSVLCYQCHPQGKAG